jgi:hypothetical protein
VCHRFIALATFLAIAELLMDFPAHVLRSRKKGCGPLFLKEERVISMQCGGSLLLQPISGSHSVIFLYRYYHSGVMKL